MQSSKKPKAKKTTTRKVSVAFTVTDAQRQELTENAARAGLSRASYSRKRALKQRVGISFSEEIYRTLFQLASKIMKLEDADTREQLLPTTRKLIQLMRSKPQDLPL